MQHVLNLSYGKDSLACLGAIEQLGRPLDRIVTADIWATDTIQADLPPMVKFKKKADAIIKARWSIEVEHVRANVSYEEAFYKVFKKGKNEGRIYGWPFQKGPWCNSRQKRGALDKIGENCVQYWGIAADETDRIAKHKCKRNVAMLLVDAGWTEAMCKEWCKKNGLLSPIYATATRGGCWFCHNQSVGQLRLLRRNYPDYWALMLQWDNDSPVAFRPDGHTVHDFEKRFRLEDEGFLKPGDKHFRWSQLHDELNLRFF